MNISSPFPDGEKFTLDWQQQAKLIELAYDAIIVRDQESAIISWNRGAEQLYGWTAQEAIGKITHDLLQTRFPVSREALDSFLATGEQWEGELVHTCKDGTQVIVESRQVVMRDPQNCPIAILEINRDITERRQREQEDQERYRELAALVESADVPIIGKTSEGIITSWNRAAAQMYGYSAQEAIGQSITIIFPPERQDEFVRIMEQIAQGVRVDLYETVRQKKDGTHLPVSVTVSPIRDSAGRIIGASDIAHDITERKRIQAQEQFLYREVQQSRNQLNIILQGVADGVIAYASDDRILYANEVAAQMTGYASIQEMLAVQQYSILNRYEIIDEQGQPFPLSQITHKRVFAGEPEAQSIIGYREIGAEQNERWSLVKSRPVLGENGEVAMVVTITRDITEHINVERRKDAFISMASHELKTPVTSLKGFTNVLQRRLTKQGDAQGLHYLARMDAQLNKLTMLISELLDISRMQSGKLDLRSEPFDLDTLVDETVENVQAATTTHHLLIEGRTDSLVLGDKERLGQVLINLLTNAIKYSPRSEKVIVRLFRDGDLRRAIVSIQDFGIGIDQAHHEKIFERFYQVTDPEEKTYPGLGIGLYISSEIVAWHQGRMWVESGKGKGATFFVALPLLEAEEQDGLQ